MVVKLFVEEAFQKHLLSQNWIVSNATTCPTLSTISPSKNGPIKTDCSRLKSTIIWGKEAEKEVEEGAEKEGGGRGGERVEKGVVIRAEMGAQHTQLTSYKLPAMGPH